MICTLGLEVRSTPFVQGSTCLARMHTGANRVKLHKARMTQFAYLEATMGLYKKTCRYLQ
jgi:hypothetical protein